LRSPCTEGGATRELRFAKAARPPRSTARSQGVPLPCVRRRVSGCPPARLLPTCGFCARLRRPCFVSTQLKSSERASIRAVEGASIQGNLAAPHRVVPWPGRTQTMVTSAWWASPLGVARRLSQTQPLGDASERSIATPLIPSLAHGRPDQSAAHTPQSGGQRR
jgi:hypothetical protein